VVSGPACRVKATRRQIADELARQGMIHSEAEAATALLDPACSVARLNWSRRRTAFLLRHRLPDSIRGRLPEGTFEVVVRSL
jgi:predicted component of type VI protein secretion system